MELFIIMVVYVFVILLEFIPLVKKNDKKQTCFYLIILILTFTILVLNSLGINILSLIS